MAPAEAAYCLPMPSYESENGALAVYDLLVAHRVDDQLMLLPRSYGWASALSPDGMARLHRGEGAWEAWRPFVYRKTAFAGEHVVDPFWQYIGSQPELAWRRGLHDVMLAGPEGLAMDERDARAGALLRALLSPQQRIELALGDSFRIVGASGRHYRVELGDGFYGIDADTHEAYCSYCLHTEEWMPHADVALATMLALGDADLEADCLENAHRFDMAPPRAATPGEVTAARWEREQLAA
jgi:hypothetical protein